jgi:hypothetical protein
MHSHNFNESEWPFNFPINRMAVTTKYVMDGSRPITSVLLDDENEWLILCDTTLDPADGMVICMGCLYTKFPFLGNFAGLKIGWEAHRENEDAEWEICQTDYDDE